MERVVVVSIFDSPLLSGSAWLVGALDECCKDLLGPQLLGAALRTTQQAVDQERVVGVGGYLRRDPGGQPDECPRQCLAEAKDPLEPEKATSIRCLRPVCLCA